MHRYTEEEKVFIKNNCKGITTNELHRMFIEKFKVDVSLYGIRNHMRRNKLHSKVDTTFKKNQTPHNKGKKMPHKSETQFIKGNLPPSHKPLGSEVVKEGCVWIKVAEPNGWERKHRYLWKKEYGTIPKDMVVRFKDGDKLNCTLDNLFLTPRCVCTSVVRREMESENPDLNVTTHKLAELELKIKDLEKRGYTYGD